MQQLQYMVVLCEEVKCRLVLSRNFDLLLAVRMPQDPPFYIPKTGVLKPESGGI